MPTLAEYYKLAGGDPGRLSGLFQYAGSGAAAGLSMEQILKNYMGAPSADTQAANSAGETAFNSAYMGGNAMNPNDANAYAIQNWKNPQLQAPIANQAMYDKFDFSALPDTALQQGGGAVTPTMHASDVKTLAYTPKGGNLIATTPEQMAARNSTLSSYGALMNNERTQRMNQNTMQRAANAGSLPTGTVFSNGSATAGGYNKPEGIQPLGTTGGNQTRNPNNVNNYYSNSTGTGGETRQPTTPTAATASTPYLSRLGDNKMAYSGAPRYNDFQGISSNQSTGNIIEAPKTPTLDGTRRGNIDFSKALWR